MKQGDDSYDWKVWSKFWSFAPIVRPPVPTADPSVGHAEEASPSISTADLRPAHSPIDGFIQATLRQQGLTPSPEADKLTLLRRVTYDLTGLPPTPEEIRAFVADSDLNAYEAVVDRLLASPHYGERWGRHWLDVARYTPGRISFPAVKGTAGDSHYRDYVVRAFNNDKPYDRFVTEQLAGDLLPVPSDRQAYLDQIIAPAFLSIGAWFDMETDPNRLRLEIIDEQINTTTKAFLGVSVACARCHDHKFDPIPTHDYYALAGIFRSTRVVGDFSEYWRDGRVRQLRALALPDQVRANDAIRQHAAELRAERWAVLQSEHDRLITRWRADEAGYRRAAGSVPRPFIRAVEAEDFDGQDNLRITQLMRDGKSVEVVESQTPTVQWLKYKFEVPDTGDYRLDALYSTGSRTPLEVTCNGEVAAKEALVEPTGGSALSFQRWDTVATLPMRVGLNFVRLNAKSGEFPRIDRLRLVHVDPAVDSAIQSAAEKQGLDARLLRRFVEAPDDPWPTVADTERHLSPDAATRVSKLSGEADAVEASVKPYPLAVAVTDQAAPVDLPVFLRGQTYRQSEYLVARGVPRFLDAALPRPTIPPTSSGRLELAGWLTDPRNPLTSRVMVNRIWAWHFGRGLVDSPSDFGSRGSAPSHPALLDWLASTFMEQGWSIKALQRSIVTSATYRQQSSGQVVAADPQDRWLSSFPRQRLEAEPLYDAMLSTTNALVRQSSGQPLDFSKSSNRAMYTLTTGRSPPNLGLDVRKMMSLFDANLEGEPIGSRPVSATPAQSLFWLNSPLVKFFADKFADRLLKMDKLGDEKRVEMAYLLAVGRSPTAAISRQSLDYLRQAEEDGETRQQAWSRFCQALYASTEFRYVN